MFETRTWIARIAYSSPVFSRIDIRSPVHHLPPPTNTMNLRHATGIHRGTTTPSYPLSYFRNAILHKPIPSIVCHNGPPPSLYHFWTAIPWTKPPCAALRTWLSILSIFPCWAWLSSMKPLHVIPFDKLHVVDVGVTSMICDITNGALQHRSYQLLSSLIATSYARYSDMPLAAR